MRRARLNLLNPFKESLRKNFPNLYMRSIKIRLLAVSLLDGSLVKVDIKIVEPDSLDYDYQYTTKVRQSRRSPRRWSYVPENTPVGEYIFTLRRK